MAGTVFQSIRQCRNCKLHCNQPPLLDNKKSADVIWVGLSAVRVEQPDKEKPLSNNTNSGKLIQQIEEQSHGVSFYRTNLVKCLPEKENKIRYPNQAEMDSCSEHLESEIKKFKPKVVVLLGKQVADFVSDNAISNYKPIEKDGTVFISVEHPSYILVYKRKKLDRYVSKIAKIITDQISKQSRA